MAKVTRRAKTSAGKRVKASATAAGAAARKAAKNASKAAAKVAKATAKAARPAKAAKKARPAKPAKKASPAKPAKAARKGRAAGRRAPDVAHADPVLFEALTEGERADALRVLTEDKRLASMAKVGRYKVIAVEPLVVKPPHELVGTRLARLLVYDYASDRCVDACVDLDASAVTFLAVTRAQPMLSREEEATAIAIAMSDERVAKQLSLGDEPQLAMHYWSRNTGDLAYARRSAAVLFGPRGGNASLVAVVDLLDDTVADVVPADQW
jgi:hypothetical protein